ncbi:MAG: hypothetical protein SFU84_12645 [Gemmatimonadales bacterium]|nr:hypothetical protein [Gemmatimonadales bacterium]
MFPFVGFTLLTIWWIVRDTKVPPAQPTAWGAIRWRWLLGAVVLTPLIALTFQQVDDYGAMAKVATGLAIVQWLMLITSVDDPGPASAAVGAIGQRE